MAKCKGCGKEAKITTAANQLASEKFSNRLKNRTEEDMPATIAWHTSHDTVFLDFKNEKGILTLQATHSPYLGKEMIGNEVRLYSLDIKDVADAIVRSYRAREIEFGSTRGIASYAIGVLPNKGWVIY